MHYTTIRFILQISDTRCKIQAIYGNERTLKPIYSAHYQIHWAIAGKNTGPNITEPIHFNILVYLIGPRVMCVD